MASSIPVVDLRDFDAGGDRRAAFTQTLGDALADLGFVAVTHHGVEHSLLEDAYRLSAEVFALPVSTKQQHETPEDGRQRGYTSFGVEHAKDQDAPDLKEFWHVGRELPETHPLRVSGDVPANRFPHEVPEFSRVMKQLFISQERFANRLLEAVGDYLGLAEHTFRDLVQDGNSVLRVIHYPDTGDTVPAGAVRAAQHEDINLLTVLPASTQPGLELLTRDGSWLPVQTPPNVMICDTGDMMQLITGGRLPATTHRVVNPEASDGGRLSMPFFLHPSPDQMLTPFFDDSAPSIPVREFFLSRLREIGVA
ncbi:MAG: isopenicillin N synthase family dioxygenase [Myxococcota bacterium]